MARVYIVEDDEVERNLLEAALRRRGHFTRWTDASTVAMQDLDGNAGGANAFDIVVIDAVVIRREPYGNLLRGEGINLMRRIRASKQLQSLPAIGTTKMLPVDYQSPWEHEFIPAGGNAFVTKVFGWEDEVADWVDKLLSRASAEGSAAGKGS